MGLSDKPLLRYSTSEMAKDVLEILDHLGWTAERELHVAGVSMGSLKSTAISSNKSSGFDGP
jgi:pimeloyl-ACP methyl ester carboxylesterase